VNLRDHHIIDCRALPSGPLFQSRGSERVDMTRVALSSRSALGNVGLRLLAPSQIPLLGPQFSKPVPDEERENHWIPTACLNLF